jgi:hypothetical protein
MEGGRVTEQAVWYRTRRRTEYRIPRRRCNSEKPQKFISLKEEKEEEEKNKNIFTGKEILLKIKLRM